MMILKKGIHLNVWSAAHVMVDMWTECLAVCDRDQRIW